jgi:hypothetical protein
MSRYLLMLLLDRSVTTTRNMVVVTICTAANYLMLPVCWLTAAFQRAQ